MTIKHLSLLLIFFNLKLFSIQKVEYWINIFVHGSVGLKETFNLKTFRRLVRDQVDNSVYEKNVRAIRNNSKIFEFQAIQELGLKEINSRSSKKYKGAYLFAKSFDQMLKKLNKNTKNKYYTFGWSGLISYKRRLSEAKIFYKELKTELERLNKKGYQPKIRIIGYSHGATLVFNFAQIRDTIYRECKDAKSQLTKDKFVIDELIAIGMPVLQSTANNAKHDMFKKIYHFYSLNDNVQTLDIFSPCSTSSQRMFNFGLRGFHPAGYARSNLKQIQIKISKISKKYYNGRWQEIFIDYSPDHYDLWFFGYANKRASGARLCPAINKKNNLEACLRDAPPFYPIPTAIFIPYFIDIIDKQLNQANHIVINLLPENQTAIINEINCKNKKATDFINFKEIDCLKKLINNTYSKILDR